VGEIIGCYRVFLSWSIVLLQIPSISRAIEAVGRAVVVFHPDYLHDRYGQLGLHGRGAHTRSKPRIESKPRKLRPCGIVSDHAIGVPERRPDRGESRAQVQFHADSGGDESVLQSHE
jgi:hypothetical protein